MEPKTYKKIFLTKGNGSVRHAIVSLTKATGKKAQLRIKGKIVTDVELASIQAGKMSVLETTLRSWVTRVERDAEHLLNRVTHPKTRENFDAIVVFLASCEEKSGDNGVKTELVHPNQTQVKKQEIVMALENTGKTPISYRTRYLGAELGTVIAKLARKVRSRATLKDRGKMVRKTKMPSIRNNTEIISEFDLRSFLKEIESAGRWNDTQQEEYLTITAFLSEVDDAKKLAEASVNSIEVDISTVSVSNEEEAQVPFTGVDDDKSIGSSPTSTNEKAENTSGKILSPEASPADSHSFPEEKSSDTDDAPEEVPSNLSWKKTVQASLGHGKSKKRIVLGKNAERLVRYQNKIDSGFGREVNENSRLLPNLVNTGSGLGNSSQGAVTLVRKMSNALSVSPKFLVFSAGTATNENIEAEMARFKSQAASTSTASDSKEEIPQDAVTTSDVTSGVESGDVDDNGDLSGFPNHTSPGSAEVTGDNESSEGTESEVTASDDGVTGADGSVNSAPSEPSKEVDVVSGDDSGTESVERSRKAEPISGEVAAIAVGDFIVASCGHKAPSIGVASASSENLESNGATLGDGDTSPESSSGKEDDGWVSNLLKRSESKPTAESGHHQDIPPGDVSIAVPVRIWTTDELVKMCVAGIIAQLPEGTESVRLLGLLEKAGLQGKITIDEVMPGWEDLHEAEIARDQLFVAFDFLKEKMASLDTVSNPNHAAFADALPDSLNLTK